MGAMCAVFFLAVALAAACGGGEAAIVEHTFVVSQMKLNRRLCNDTLVTVVNGQLPGPTIEVTEGDSVVVHVVNKSPRGVTIHWHGVKQKLNCWADGPTMITQCPIQPNKNFTYRFNVIGQEGTLWWHAHQGSLRATLYGMLIIRPRLGPNSYPFPKPDKDIPIVIGEWFDLDLAVLEKRVANRIYDDRPRAATINGHSNCSGVMEDNYILDIEHGDTYLLRIVNAAMDEEYNFRIAGHKFVVVAADANYVKPYTTDTIVVASGQTIDALVVADAPPGRYYMVIQALRSWTTGSQIPTLIARGIVSYKQSKWSDDDSPIVAPEFPDRYNGTQSLYFHGNLTSLLPQNVPATVDDQLLIVIDTGKNCLYDGATSCMVSKLNNISFVLPERTSLLQAQYNKSMTSSVHTLQQFPSRPLTVDFSHSPTSTATTVRNVRYNSTVEIVFQGSPVPFGDSNPMHLHGYDFFILAQGIGLYDEKKDVQKYNLVDPPVRNTALSPMYGWTAIRFVANNPGVWYLHCHIEHHASSGMALVLIVEDGPTLDTTLPPPPADYPICDDENSIVADE